MARVNITAQEALQYLLGFTALGAASSLLGGGSTSDGGGTTTEYPRSGFQVDVNYSPGAPRENATLDRRTASKATVMQSLKQHNDALMKFVKPGMNAAQRKAAIQKGLEEEKSLLEFWNDRNPRKPINAISSAIRSIRITPDNRVQVQWGSSPKWYSYIQSANPREASLKLRELATSPSIGRALCRKSKKGNNGWWAKNYYDPSMSM